MRVSFLEIYNEELFDLLSPSLDNQKMRLFEDSARKVRMGMWMFQNNVEGNVKQKIIVLQCVLYYFHHLFIQWHILNHLQ